MYRELVDVHRDRCYIAMQACRGVWSADLPMKGGMLHSSMPRQDMHDVISRRFLLSVNSETLIRRAVDYKRLALGPVG